MDSIYRSELYLAADASVIFWLLEKYARELRERKLYNDWISPDHKCTRFRIFLWKLFTQAKKTQIIKKGIKYHSETNNEFYEFLLSERSILDPEEKDDERKTEIREFFQEHSEDIELLREFIKEAIIREEKIIKAGYESFYDLRVDYEKINKKYTAIYKSNPSADRSFIFKTEMERIEDILKEEDDFIKIAKNQNSITCKV